MAERCSRQNRQFQLIASYLFTILDIIVLTLLRTLLQAAGREEEEHVPASRRGSSWQRQQREEEEGLLADRYADLKSIVPCAICPSCNPWQCLGLSLGMACV